MAYLNGKPLFFGAQVHPDETSEEKLQAARQEGRLAEQSDFWDMFQNGGKRNAYGSAFARWSAEYIRPKHKIVPTNSNSTSSTFESCVNLKKVEAQYFDFSQKEEGTTNNAGCYYTFNGCNNLEEIEDIGLLPQRNYYNTFAYCYKLKTIAKMGVDENTKFNASTFTQCNALENLTIDGTIGQNGLNLKDCQKLSKQSIQSVLGALSENAEHLNTLGGTPAITLSKTAVENAGFGQIDCLHDAIFTAGVSEGGLTILCFKSGEIMLNGTYNGGESGTEPFFFDAARVTMDPLAGCYRLVMEEYDPTYFADLYTTGGLYLHKDETEYTTPTSEAVHVKLVINPNVRFNNFVIHPKVLYDEWQSLVYRKEKLWNINLV